MIDTSNNSKQFKAKKKKTFPIRKSTNCCSGCLTFSVANNSQCYHVSHDSPINTCPNQQNGWTMVFDLIWFDIVLLIHFPTRIFNALIVLVKSKLSYFNFGICIRIYTSVRVCSHFHYKFRQMLVLFAFCNNEHSFALSVQAKIRSHHIHIMLLICILLF